MVAPPLVLYTHTPVAEALKSQGIAGESDGVTTVDMEILTDVYKRQDEDDAGHRRPHNGSEQPCHT